MVAATNSSNSNNSGSGGQLWQSQLTVSSKNRASNKGVGGGRRSSSSSNNSSVGGGGGLHEIPTYTSNGSSSASAKRANLPHKDKDKRLGMSEVQKVLQLERDRRRLLSSPTGIGGAVQVTSMSLLTH